MLKDSVLATLSYYDALDFPLTGFEMWRYLVNPARLLLRETPTGIGEISLSAVANTLEELKEKGVIDEKYGFYFLKKTMVSIVQWAPLSDLAELRLEREKIAAQKWRALRRRARW